MILRKYTIQKRINQVFMLSATQQGGRASNGAVGIRDMAVRDHLISWFTSLGTCTWLTSLHSKRWSVLKAELLSV
jgi:hypothetical protein